MIEHRAADVGDHALAGGHHQVKASPGGERQDHRQRDHAGERRIEVRRIARAEARVDDVLEPLTEREHGAGRHQQRKHGDDDA